MNADSNYYAVIMAGGIGSRFWPVSTSEFPKQFHDMLGTGQSLIQKTFSRLTPMIPESQIQILTNERYLDLVLEQLPTLKQEQAVLEPAMRNTAPCILLSALKIHKANPNAVMLVAPSDHWIEDEAAFREDVKTCFDLCAQNDMLVTLGIHPTFPNTGYGYIESDAQDTAQIKKVAQFTEKPAYEVAKQFLEAGNYLWNAGIFIWSTQSILNAFETLMPQMYQLFTEGMDDLNTATESQFVKQQYPKAENISIDYGILEKADNVFVKRATFDWNDLGTWGALHDKLRDGDANNAVVRASHHLREAQNNMIYTQNEKLVVVDGVSDYIIVDKDDVLLIYPKEKEQDIKKLVSEINENFGKKYS